MSLLVKQILELGERQLREQGIADSQRDAKLLYCYMNNINTAALILEYQQTLQDVLCDKYFELIDRRSLGEPLQYITGTQEFMGYEFNVDKRVLIPRQDTETLVELAVEYIKEGKLMGNAVEGASKKNTKILDLCCGSGAIGISLSKLIPSLKVTLSDMSQDALDVAKANGNKLGVAKNVAFKCGNLFEPFKKRFGKERFDVIVTNPPYIPSSVIDTLQKEVKDFEPRSALDGGISGLDFYTEIVRESKNHLNPKGALFMEIGHDQGDSIKTLLENDGNYQNVEIFKDLAGHDRVVFALLKKM